MTGALSEHDFPTAIDDRYLEDYVPGAVYSYGSIALSADEIVAFAREWDPQPFHVDAEAAERSVFGGLIASGWHTTAVTMRLLVRHVISGVASLGSPGCDELRWLAPVRPGDELSIRVEVLSNRRSHSKPDRGFSEIRTEVLNQSGQIVMSLRATLILLARSATEPI